MAGGRVSVVYETTRAQLGAQLRKATVHPVSLLRKATVHPVSLLRKATPVMLKLRHH